MIIAMVLVGHFLDRFATGSFHIAYGKELHVFLLQEATQVIRAAISDSNAANRDPLAGRHGAVPTEGRAWNDLRSHNGGAGGDCSF
jgi:hypothetical protein